MREESLLIQVIKGVRAFSVPFTIVVILIVPLLDFFEEYIEKGGWHLLFVIVCAIGIGFLTSQLAHILLRDEN